MDRFRELVAAQGGDLSRPLPIGAYSETIPAPRDGTMGHIDAMAVGLAVWRLGAGRSVPGERVQFGAGLRIHRRPGEPVAAGEALFTLYTDTPERFEAAMAELDGALECRRRRAATSPADHRSDYASAREERKTMTTPLTSTRSGRRPRRCCTTTSTAGCDRRPCWSSPSQTGYDELPATDVDELGDVVPHRRAQRIAGALPRTVRPHRRRDADAGGAAPGRLRVRRGPGRRQRRLRRDPVRARTAHRPRAVAGRGGRRRAGRLRRRREGRQRRGPRHHRALPGHRDAARGAVTGDRRAGDPVPGQGRRRLRHRRCGGRLPADAASRRVRVHAKQQRPLHHSRR